MARQMRWVLDYAAQQASGVAAWQRDTEHIEKSLVFGGFPARNGVSAALLIQLGGTGVEDILSGPDNFLMALAPKADPLLLAEKLGERFAVAETNIKKWTVGSPIQAPLDAIENLRKRRPFDADDVRSVVVRVATSEARTVNGREMPDICLQHMVAVMLVDKTASFEAAHDKPRRQDAAILRQRAKVQLVLDEALERLYPRREAIVEITLSDGTHLTERVSAVRGTADNPMTREEVVAKARDLLTPLLGASKAKGLIDVVLTLDVVKDIRAPGPFPRQAGAPGAEIAGIQLAPRWARRSDSQAFSRTVLIRRARRAFPFSSTGFRTLGAFMFIRPCRVGGRHLAGAGGGLHRGTRVGARQRRQHAGASFRLSGVTGRDLWRNTTARGWRGSLLPARQYPVSLPAASLLGAQRLPTVSAGKAGTPPPGRRGADASITTAPDGTIQGSMQFRRGRHDLRRRQRDREHFPVRRRQDIRRWARAVVSPHKLTIEDGASATDNGVIDLAHSGTRIPLTLGKKGVAGSGVDSSCADQSPLHQTAISRGDGCSGGGTPPGTRVVKFERPASSSRRGKKAWVPANSTCYTLALTRGTAVRRRQNNRIEIFDQNGTFIAQWRSLAVRRHYIDQ